MYTKFLYLDFPETGGITYYSPILRNKKYSFVKTSKHFFKKHVSFVHQTKNIISYEKNITKQNKSKFITGHIYLDEYFLKNNYKLICTLRDPIDRFKSIISFYSEALSSDNAAKLWNKNIKLKFGNLTNFLKEPLNSNNKLDELSSQIAISLYSKN